MNAARIRSLIEKHKNGEISTDDLMGVLEALPCEDLGFARIDHHRQDAHRLAGGDLRRGEEPGPDGGHLPPLPPTTATSSARGSAEWPTRSEPVDGVEHLDRPCRLGSCGEPPPRGLGWSWWPPGTSDIPVAEEAAVDLEFLGRRVVRRYDVGVAGLHRLSGPPRPRRLPRAVVVAGIEGALPSVVAGLVEMPVVAVPTSVGYGASFGGIAALLAMMNSCAPGSPW